MGGHLPKDRVQEINIPGESLCWAGVNGAGNLVDVSSKSGQLLLRRTERILFMADLPIVIGPVGSGTRGRIGKSYYDLPRFRALSRA
jgi:hypothetical protein